MPFTFTSHYVSINSREFNVDYGWLTTFTFHNVSINSDSVQRYASYAYQFAPQYVPINLIISKNSSTLNLFLSPICPALSPLLLQEPKIIYQKINPTFAPAAKVSPGE